MTRSAERAQEFIAAGLSPIVADITNAENLKTALTDLPAMDTIVFAVGMDRSRYDDIYDVYVEGLRRFIDSYPHPIKHLIYVSSTGVYGDFGGDWAHEDSPTLPAREGGKACLMAEALLAEATDNWTVLRMAGLYGGSRVPTKTLIQNRDWNKLSPHGYLNLIHQTDAVAAIAKTAVIKPMQEIMLCSDGHPPVRKDYYQHIADQFEIGSIPWPAETTVDPKSRSANSKRISNEKMLRLLDLELVHPDYKSGLAELF
jgi:nucleoside-diphosphate-sugar epimerase